MTYGEKNLLKQQLHELLDIAIEANNIGSLVYGEFKEYPVINVEYNGYYNTFEVKVIGDIRTNAIERSLYSHRLSEPLDGDIIKKVYDECSEIFRTVAERNIRRAEAAKAVLEHFGEER